MPARAGLPVNSAEEKLDDVVGVEFLEVCVRLTHAHQHHGLPRDVHHRDRSPDLGQPALPVSMAAERETGLEGAGLRESGGRKGGTVSLMVSKRGRGDGKGVRAGGRKGGAFSKLVSG